MAANRPDISAPDGVTLLVAQLQWVFRVGGDPGSSHTGCATQGPHVCQQRERMDWGDLELPPNCDGQPCSQAQCHWHRGQLAISPGVPKTE